MRVSILPTPTAQRAITFSLRLWGQAGLFSTTIKMAGSTFTWWMGSTCRICAASYPPINLSYRDETHYWVEKDYRPGLSFKGLVDESAYQVAPATTDSPKGNKLYRNEGDGTFREVEGGSRGGRYWLWHGPWPSAILMRMATPISTSPTTVPTSCIATTAARLSMLPKGRCGGSALEHQCPVLRLR